MDKPSSTGRKLSVAMIACNAEATIAAALASVREIADEIVVVDTGSTDRTCDVARSRASKLVNHAWQDDFSAARNFALANITGDWVLWLDASEQLDADSARAIREEIDRNEQPKTAYLMLVQLPPGAGQVDGEQIGQVRLWPTKAGLKFNGRVRETIEPPLEAAGLAQENTAWKIARSPQDVDPQVKADKAHRNIRLAELEINEQGERPKLLLALGEAWAALSEPLKAAGWFRRVIDEAPVATTEQLEAYYGLLTTFDSRPQVRDEQVATCLEALQVFPLDAQLLCAMGSYLQGQGRLDLACRSYQMAVEHGQVNLGTWHLANLADVATMCYSMTLDLQGQPDEARRVIETSLTKRGPSDRLRRQLIDLHIKHNRRQEALAEVGRLSDAVPQRELLRDVVRGACLAAQQQWPAALVYLKTAYEARCRDVICFRWLATSLIATGDYAAAEPLLRHWQAAAPENPEASRMLATLLGQQQRAAAGAEGGELTSASVHGNGHSQPRRVDELSPRHSNGNGSSGAKSNVASAATVFKPHLGGSPTALPIASNGNHISH